MNNQELQKQFLRVFRYKFTRLGYHPTDLCITPTPTGYCMIIKNSINTQARMTIDTAQIHLGVHRRFGLWYTKNPENGVDINLADPQCVGKALHWLRQIDS